MFGSSEMTPEKMYNLICSAFAHAGYKYETDPSNRIVKSVFQGDDLPICLVAKVDQMSVALDCILAFETEEPKYMELSWNLNLINNKSAFGSFRLDPEKGCVYYHYAYVFAGAKPSERLMLSLVKMVVDTVDQHDGDLKKIANVSVDPYSHMFA